MNYPDFGDLFADLAAAGRQGGSVANLLMGDYAGLARERGGHLAWTQLAGLLEIIDEGLISHNQAADVLEELYKSDFSARQIVQKKAGRWLPIRISCGR